MRVEDNASKTCTVTMKFQASVVSPSLVGVAKQPIIVNRALGSANDEAFFFFLFWLMPFATEKTRGEREYRHMGHSGACLEKTLHLIFMLHKGELMHI